MEQTEYKDDLLGHKLLFGLVTFSKLFVRDPLIYFESNQPHLSFFANTPFKAYFINEYWMHFVKSQGS